MDGQGGGDDEDRGVGIGVDLGTGGFSVAVWNHERQAVEIVANGRGRQRTPCCVSFTDEGRVLGEDAESLSARNSGNTIFDALMLVGCAQDDCRTSRSAELWPFVVCCDLPVEAARQRLALASLSNPRLAERASVDVGYDIMCSVARAMAPIQARTSPFSRALVQVQHHGRHRRFVPEQLLAMFLSEAKATAEAHLGTKVSEIVLTTSAAVGVLQCRALEDAARIAGLTALRVQPAATLCMMGDREERLVCIIDIGGGTCDVSLLECEDGILETEAVASCRCGGRDFDERLMRHLLAEFAQAHGLDASEDPRALSRLRKECRQAKHTLSSCLEATIELDSFSENQDFYTRVSRASFEALNADLFDRLLDPIKRVFTRIGKERVDKVILTGGSSRVPMVRSMIDVFFGCTVRIGVGRVPVVSIPDKSAAVGAQITFSIQK